MADFWCMTCGKKNSFNRMYPKAEDICIGCQQKPTWRTNPEPLQPDDVPRVMWNVSENDKHFLKSIRIDPEG